MREIKFRAKGCEMGEWLHGSLIKRKGFYPSILFPNPTEDGKVANGTYKGFYIAPCGMDFGAKAGHYGSNYTPPKKKRKKIK